MSLNRVKKLGKIRSQFPIIDKSIYLNHAGTGPLSINARKTIERCIETYSKQAEFDIDDYFQRLKAARCAVARLINAKPQEITFTHNTSEGIYIALINLPLEKDDAILVMDEVFPAVRYVVDHNMPNVIKHYAPFHGRQPVEVIENCKYNVKAVVVDYVHYLTGERLDLATLAAYCRSHDIFLVVDGIQAVGAQHFDVREIEVDFLACGAAKWLFGPSGTGFLFISQRMFPFLKRLHTGWLGASWQGFEDCETRPDLYPDARMFEQGTRNIIGISALAENCRILKDYGTTEVEDNILMLKRQLREGFKEMDFQIITPEQGFQSGIITIKTAVAQNLYRQLKNSVTISLRSGCLRFSPHFYNCQEEISKALKLLRNIKSR